MLHFKFLVSLLNVILKISPLQRSEQKGKNEINPKDITQYQNMRYIFLHLVATESSICITSWNGRDKSFQILLNFKRYFGCKFREYKDGIMQLLIIFGDLRCLSLAISSVLQKIKNQKVVTKACYIHLDK